jgi:hypothetical protein
MKIMLDIEWGEQPFAFGDDSWPAPLIRPSRYPADANPVFDGEPVEAPDDFLERYQKAEREFLDIQAELTELARKHGDLQ